MAIYKIRNLVNGKFYIGSSVKVLSRWYLHKYRLKKGDHDNLYLQGSFNKYGSENFIFEIVEYVHDINSLISREQYFIDTLVPEYNLCKHAGNVLGRKHSEDTKQKMSISISRAKKGKPSHRKGSKYTPEQYERIVTANRRPWSDERRLKHRLALIGKKRSPEVLQRMGKWLTGLDHSKKWKPVVKLTIDYTLIEEYKSLTEAAKKSNTNLSSISGCITGKSPSNFGYIWMYKDKFQALKNEAS